MAYNSTNTLGNPRSDLYVKKARIPRNTCHPPHLQLLWWSKKKDLELAHRTRTPYTCRLRGIHLDKYVWWLVPQHAHLSGVNVELAVVTPQKQMHTNSGRGLTTLANPRSDLYIKRLEFQGMLATPHLKLLWWTKKALKISELEIAHRTRTP